MAKENCTDERIDEMAHEFLFQGLADVTVACGYGDAAKNGKDLREAMIDSVAELLYEIWTEKTTLEVDEKERMAARAHLSGATLEEVEALLRG